MQDMYNCTGEERKALVQAVGGIVGIKPRYRGAPSFTFEVGDYEITSERFQSAAAPFETG